MSCATHSVTCLLQPWSARRNASYGAVQARGEAWPHWTHCCGTEPGPARNPSPHVGEEGLLDSDVRV